MNNGSAESGGETLRVREDRRHIEGLLDAMEEADKESHREGWHDPGEYDDCPLCQEAIKA